MSKPHTHEDCVECLQRELARVRVELLEITAYAEDLEQENKRLAQRCQEIAGERNQSRARAEYLERRGVLEAATWPCFEHADNCCADWCAKCKESRTAIAALEAFDKEHQTSIPIAT